MDLLITGFLNYKKTAFLNYKKKPVHNRSIKLLRFANFGTYWLFCVRLFIRIKKVIYCIIQTAFTNAKYLCLFDSNCLLVHLRGYIFDSIFCSKWMTERCSIFTWGKSQGRWHNFNYYFLKEFFFVEFFLFPQNVFLFVMNNLCKFWHCCKTCSLENSTAVSTFYYDL